MTSFALGYQQAAVGNVGDDLNPWLLKRLLPRVRFEASDQVLLCIGSILVSERWDSYSRKLVLGSGARALDRLPKLDSSWDVRFVRGPHSAKALGVKFISDPALLISRFVSPATHRKGVGIVPYYRSSRRHWSAIAARLGARIVSPHLDVERFVDALNRCERVFCEAMHGSIFADALRIPWRPVTFQNIMHEGEAHQFKWRDWVASVDLPFDPVVQVFNSTPSDAKGVIRNFSARLTGLQSSWKMADALQKALKEGKFYLTDNEVIQDRVSRMESEFNELNREL
jgi:succinoglycan biosynthesis protein ExoV